MDERHTRRVHSLTDVVSRQESGRDSVFALRQQLMQAGKIKLELALDRVAFGLTLGQMATFFHFQTAQTLQLSQIVLLGRTGFLKLTQVFEDACVIVFFQIVQAVERLQTSLTRPDQGFLAVINHEQTLILPRLKLTLRLFLRLAFKAHLAGRFFSRTLLGSLGGTNVLDTPPLLVENLVGLIDSFRRNLVAVMHAPAFIHPAVQSLLCQHGRAGANQQQTQPPSTHHQPPPFSVKIEQHPCQFFPMHDILAQLALLLISLVANLLSALAGGGAGLLQLPALIFLGLPFATALATHKVASVALGVGATLRHLRSGTLRPGFTLLILASGLPGVVLGANLILQVDETLSQIALGLMTIGLGLYSWKNPGLGEKHSPCHRTPIGLLTGGVVLLGIGVLNGSLTSGTGLMVTLWLVRWFGLEFKQAIAYTMILVGLFWNGTGAITLGLLTEIRWDWLPALLLGSLIGGYLGAHLSLIKGNRFIKRVFEFTTLATGAGLLWRALD